jgi:hypothetical protein
MIVEFPSPEDGMAMAWQVAVKDEAGQPINTITSLMLHFSAEHQVITALAYLVDPDHPNWSISAEYAVTKVSFR